MILDFLQRARRSFFVAYIPLLLLTMLLLPRDTHAQSGRLYHPEDRVLISDFTNVYSLARDNNTLYAVTPNGLLEYDIIQRRFKLPLTIEDGYPALERPLSVAYSNASFQLAIGTAQGTVYAVNTLSNRFDNVARINGPVSQLVAAPDAFDLYAGTQQSWFRLHGGSYIAEPVSGPPAIVQPGANDPYLRAAIGDAGHIPGRTIPAPVTSIENDRIESSYYVGTRGNGIVHLDTRTLLHTRLPFGLNTRGAASLASWNGRIFFGGDERTTAGALVSSTPELADFRDYSPSMGAPQEVITSLLGTDSALWVGTVDGLYALRGRTGAEHWQNFTHDIPDRITSIAGDGVTIFAGSGRGLVHLQPDGRVETVLGGRSVYGLAPVRDTLWIACDVGLAAMPLRSSVLQASALAGGGSPATPVFDVRWMGDTLYAVTADALYKRGPTGWVEPDRFLRGRLGPMGRLRTDGTSLWVLGSLGFAVKGAKSTDWSYYMATDDIPEAPVRDLLPLGNAVWLATPAGALRVLNPR